MPVQTHRTAGWSLRPLLAMMQVALLIALVLAAEVASAPPAQAAGSQFEQGVKVYDIDLPVVATSGFYPMHATAADAFKELHRCFNCSFPGPGAPADFPAQGEFMPLEYCPPRTPTSLCLEAPVVAYSNEGDRLMWFVGQPGHFDGAGSIVFFQFNTDAQGVLHMRVTAYATEPFYGIPGGAAIAAAIGQLAWPVFAETLGTQMFFNTCGGSTYCPRAPSPAPAPHALDLRFDCPNLQQGSTGACVTLLQKLLNGHGASLTVDGIFGPATDAAVRRFQSQSGLIVDGIVGPQTKSALYGSPTKALDLRTACGLLLRGSAGPCVTQLQKLLNSKGASLTVDGIFGSATESAVRSFQSSHGLVVDGIVGPRTKAALYGTSSGLDLRSDCGLLQQGSTGACVSLLQRMLNSHGANLAVDGIFGPLTDSAVRSFQSSSGLTVDGIVGPNTKAALYGGGGGTHSVDLRTDCGMLAQGSSGPCVAELQYLLNSRGANLAVDGIFGSLTTAAVRSFQTSHRLLVDGIVGPQTKAALYAGGVASIWGGVDLRYECGYLQIGSTGACVVELQNLLRKQGASIAVDGIFGPLTDGAVRNFQASHGLVVDGIVGPQTKAALYGASVPTTPGAPIDYGRVIAAARMAVQEAIPYSWGGGHAATPGPSLGTCVGYTGTIQPCPASSTIGLDCSGLVRWAYWLGAGIDLGNGGNTDSQFNSRHAVHISESQKQPGDLEFFGSPADTYHVVIYSGVINGVPMMIETNRTGTNAHESPLRTGGLWVHVV